LICRLITAGACQRQGTGLQEVESSPKFRDAGIPAASEESGRSSVKLEGFAVDVLAALTADLGSRSAVVERAVRHYLDDAQLRPPGWAMPPGLGSGSGEGMVTVALDAATLAAVAAEAEAQKVGVGALAGHAVMYLWAAERGPGAATPADAPVNTPSVSAPAAPPRGRPRVSRGTSAG
jgi:hypothetical protein